MEPKLPPLDPSVSRVRTRMHTTPEDAPDPGFEAISPTEAMLVGELPVGSITEIDPVSEGDTPVSRIRNSMGRISDKVAETPITPSRVKSSMIRKEGLDELSHEDPASLLEGTSVTAEGSPEVLLEKLSASTLVEAAKRVGFAAALGGSLQGTDNNKLMPRAWRSNKYRAENHDGKRVPWSNGFSNAWETGAEVADLVTGRPFDRHKFYLSLDMSTPEKSERAQLFIEEVYAQAAEKKLSMLTKNEVHDYDSCDLYTWEPEEFAGILADLYPKYPDIWLTTEHPLQGEIETIDPKHIGYVQEPIGGIGNGSHSSRMVELGKFIDASSGSLDPETWKQACETAGVRPDAPWLIDSKLRESYLASKVRD